MFIRTLTDRNNLEIVIEISNDLDFVNSTAVEWKQISDQSVEIGDYFYNNEIISPNSQTYDTIIAPVIQAGEEEFKKQTGLSVPEEPPVDLEELERLHNEQQIVIETLPVEEPIIQSGPEINRPEGFESPPLPKVPDYSDEHLTAENLTQWININNNVELYLNKLKSSDVSMIDGKVIFAPPLTYPDGTVQSEFYAIEHSDLQHLIDYITQVDVKQKELIARIQANI